MLAKGCLKHPSFVLVVSLQDKREDSSTDPLLQANFDQHQNGIGLIFLHEFQVQDVSFPTRQVSSNLEFIWSFKSAIYQDVSKLSGKPETVRFCLIHNLSYTNA